MPLKSIKGKNVKVLYSEQIPSQGACDITEMWATLRWTISPNLVTICLSKLKILHFACKHDRIRFTQRDWQSDDPITIHVYALSRTLRLWHTNQLQTCFVTSVDSVSYTEVASAVLRLTFLSSDNSPLPVAAKRGKMWTTIFGIFLVKTDTQSSCITDTMDFADVKSWIISNSGKSTGWYVLKNKSCQKRISSTVATKFKVAYTSGPFFE